MNPDDLKQVDFEWNGMDIVGIFLMDNVQGRPIIVTNWWYKNSTTYTMQVSNVSRVNYTEKDLTARVLYTI